MALRADLYTAPTAATFEALEDDLNMVSGSGTVEWSGWTDCTIEIPRDQVIASGRLVGIYDGSTLIDEFLIESQKKSVSREGDNTWSLSGPQVNGLTARIGIWPYDYPEKPSIIRDWIWDGQDVVTNGGFEDTSGTSEIYALNLDGATGGTFTLTVGGATTPGQAWNVSEADLELAIEALAGTPPVIDVDADATTDGFNIEFVDPANLDTDMTFASLLTGGGGAEELVLIQDGDNAEPANWTRSQFLDSGSDPRLHGTYASDGFRLTTGAEPVRTGAQALRINGLTQYAGAQQVVNVIPGQTYQVSAWVYTSDATETFKMILRDARTHQPLGFQDGGSIPINTWTEFTITDFIPAAGVTQVIFRIAQVVDHNPSPFYIDDATFKEGFQAATSGEIIRLLLEAAQSRLTGLWLDLDFSDTVDTLSTSWGAGIAFRAFPPQTLASALEGLHQLGINWHITRKATPSGALTHDLHAYAKGSAPDLSATVEILSPTSAISVDRLPEATSRIAFGDEGLWDELVDSAAVTSFGRWESQYDAEHLMSEAALTTFLTDVEDEEQINRLALQATMHQNDPYVPLKDFRPGDSIEWQIPAIQTTVTRPVKAISWQQGETARYQVTGSKVYDDETGLARAVEFLLDEIKPRTRPVPSVPSVTPFGGGAEMSVSVAAVDATDLSKTKADFVCDATDDRVTLEAALAQINWYGKVVLSEGTFTFDSGMLRDSGAGDVTLEGMGQNQTTITSTTTMAYLFRATTAVNWTWKDLTLNGGDVVTNSLTWGLADQGQHNMYRVTVRDFTSDGVSIGRSAGTGRFFDCIFTSNTGRGFYHRESGCWFYNCQFTDNGSDGLRIDQSSNNQIFGNIFSNNGGDGYHTGNALVAGASNMYFVGNAFINNTSFGIGISHGGGHHIQGNYFSGNGSGSLTFGAGGFGVSTGSFINGNFIKDATFLAGSDSGGQIIGVNSIGGVTEVSGNPITPHPARVQTSNFSKDGVLSTAAGVLKLPWTIAGTITDVMLAVGTSPVGQDLIVDVHKNGTTIFTTQANRPKVVDGDADGVGAAAVPPVNAMAVGDYLTIDIDQVGSPATEGDDLVVTIEWIAD